MLSLTSTPTANDGPLAPVAMVPNAPLLCLPVEPAAHIKCPRHGTPATARGLWSPSLTPGIAYETYDAYQQAPDLANTRFVSGYDFVNGDTPIRSAN